MKVRLPGGGSIGFGGKEYSSNPQAQGKQKDVIELPDAAREDMISHGLEIVKDAAGDSDAH